MKIVSKGFLSKIILLLIFVQLYYCQFAINLIPKSSFEGLSKVKIHLFSNDKFEDKQDQLAIKLWKHTKKLIKHPFNLVELKTCLQKSYVYLNKGEAALLLGKFSLFEYPMEKSYKADLIKDKTFCRDYSTENQKNIERLQVLKNYDPIDSYQRSFGKALFYFHESEQLMNEDAPIYLLFMLWMSRFTENFQGIVDTYNLPFEDLSMLLINASTIRGSKLGFKLQLSEILQCMKLEKLDYNFFDMLEGLMQNRLREILLNGTDEDLEQYFAGNSQLQKYRLHSQKLKYTPPEGAISQQEYLKIHYTQEQTSTFSSSNTIDQSMIDNIIKQIDQKGAQKLNQEMKEIMQHLGIESNFEINNEDLSQLKSELSEMKVDRPDNAINQAQIDKKFNVKNGNKEAIENKGEKEQKVVEEEVKVVREDEVVEEEEEEEDDEEEEELNEDQKEEVLDEDMKEYLEQKLKIQNQVDSRFNISNQKISKKITEEMINKIVNVLDSTIHFMKQEKNNRCMSCKNTVNIAGQVSNIPQSNSDSNGELEDEDEDISLTDQLIFQNTDITYQEMIEHNQINPTNQAEEILRMRASLGDLPAQMQLGVDYYRGNIENNIQQNHQQAFNYFQMAANQGLPQAQYNTGLLLINGQGAQRNGTKAKEYFLKAIEGGEESGFAGLGQLYLLGLDVPKNETKAALYFEQAMQAGHKDSIVNLAILYSTGFDDTPKNITKSIELLRPVVPESKRAQLFMTVQLNQGRDIGMDCDTLLGYMLKKEEHDTELDFYSQKSIKKYQVGNYEDALVYSLFASFMGYDQSYHNTGFLWKTLQREHENREKKVQSNLICAYNDYELCSMIFYYKDALLHKNESFAQVGHYIYKGSYSFSSSYQLAFQLYNSTSFLPESLHSISFLYQNGQYVEKNISKAIEYNDMILKKVFNNEVEFKNFFPAIIRKVFLYILNLCEKVYDFFSFLF